MTVLEEGGGDLKTPPRKRLCLSYSRPVSSSSLATYSMATPLDAGVMLNGYGLVDSHKNHSPDDSSANSEGVSPVATLCNLGNTCFLNSVLYTLRFAPAFLHNLHHLAVDLMEYSGRYSHFKSKSSSLGRGIGGGSKSWSNKDLPSIGQFTPQEDKIAVATLRLHELYENLHNSELKDHMEPYQPEIFLIALREVNSIFEGNQQHDAHELLVCLLDNIRETCRQLSQLSERQPHPPLPPPSSLPPSKSAFSNVRKSLKLGKTKSNGIIDKKMALDGPVMNGESNMIINEEVTRVGHNFISEDFQGVTLLRTTCMECEQETERKETFCDICVPITSPSEHSDENVSSLYHSAIVTEEFLQETNKYWCEQCLRYNEAKRSVRYESLPRLLILQLKRFSSSSNGSVVSKVTTYMPTPLTLSCFCVKCKDIEENKRLHRGYQLYGVIMHLGATMASGHYVTYVCGRDTAVDCATCTRDKRKTASLSGGAGATKQLANSVPEKHAGGIFRFFTKSSKHSYANNMPGMDGRTSYFPPCRSTDCCGVKMDMAHESLWLECDDETVRTLTRKQLEEILAPKSAKNTALTPYLLFYCRVP